MKNISNKAKSAYFWDTIGVIGKQLATLTITVILSRLLEPEEFGLIGIALVFVTLSNVFVDAGFTDGIIQKKHLDEVELSSIFILNLLVGVVTLMIFWFAASPISRYFNLEQLESVIKLLAFVPLISAFGRVQAALLVKRMSFRNLTVRDLISVMLGGLVGVVMANIGYGVFALVWQQIVVAFVSSVTMWFSTKWRPRLILSISKVKPIFNFSAYVFFDQLLRQFFLKIDTLFIGKVFSPTILGFYTRAESLNSQVLNYTSSSIRKVAFPALSAINDDREKFEVYFFKAFHVACFAGVISSSVLFFMSKEIIYTLLGDKWTDSVPIFEILVFRLLFGPFGPLLGKALLAMGFSKVKFRISQIQRMILIIPLVVGYFTDIYIFAIVLVIANIINVLINFQVVSKTLEYPFRFMLRTILVAFIPFLLVAILSKVLVVPISGVWVAILFLSLQLIYGKMISMEGQKIIMRQLSNLINKLIVKIRKSSEI